MFEYTEFDPSITYKQALTVLLNLPANQELDVPLLFGLKPEECPNDVLSISRRILIDVLRYLDPEEELTYSRLEAYFILEESEGFSPFSGSFEPDPIDLAEIDKAIDAYEAEGLTGDEILTKFNLSQNGIELPKEILLPNDTQKELTLTKAFIDLDKFLTDKFNGINKNSPFEDVELAFEELEKLSAHPSIVFIMENLDISLMELFVFTVCLTSSVRGRTCDIEDITNRYKLQRMLGLELMEVVENLADRGLLHSSEGIMSEYRFGVDKKVVAAIAKNKIQDIPSRKPKGEITINTIFKLLHDKLISASRGHDNIEEAYNSLRGIRLQTYDLFPFWKEIEKYPTIEQILLLSCLDCYIVHDNVLSLNYRSYDYLTNGTQSFSTWSFEYEVNNLAIFEEGLIEEAGDSLTDKSSYSIGLTDKGIRLFLPSDEIINYFKPKKTNLNNLIYPGKLKEKQLFFSKEIQTTISDITKLLTIDNETLMNTRLQALNMKTGITILLSGAPGTGKTETAYQIAKATNRPIFMVDISSIRDKWVGESEKNVKEIFNDYQQAKKFSTITPILLLNEADALLGIRREVSSAADQMNNAMQNIFLQCLEDFEGILIATTNLVSNIDKAFDRRFLFKLNFPTPDTETRRLIWNSYFPDNELDTIIDKLIQIPLSGGEIINIVKRYELELILNRISTIEDILPIADAETSMRNASVIGFRV